MSTYGKGEGNGTGSANADMQSNIHNIINQERVVIFSKTTCPYCDDAKEVFDNIGRKYSVVELNEQSNGPQVQEVLHEMTGARTVPRVFVDGKCIGGGSETVELYKSGKLEEILENEERKPNEPSESGDPN